MGREFDRMDGNMTSFPSFLPGAHQPGPLLQNPMGTLPPINAGHPTNPNEIPGQPPMCIVNYDCRGMLRLIPPELKRSAWSLYGGNSLYSASYDAYYEFQRSELYLCTEHLHGLSQAFPQTFQPEVPVNAHPVKRKRDQYSGSEQYDSEEGYDEGGMLPHPDDIEALRKNAAPEDMVMWERQKKDDVKRDLQMQRQIEELTAEAEQIRQETHPGFKREVAKLQKERQEKLIKATKSRTDRETAIHEMFDERVRALVAEYEGEREELAKKAEIEMEQQRRLEEEYKNGNGTVRSERRIGTTRKLRKRGEEAKELSQKAVAHQKAQQKLMNIRAGIPPPTPQISYGLEELEILEDLSAIKQVPSEVDRRKRAVQRSGPTR